MTDYPAKEPTTESARIDVAEFARDGGRRRIEASVNTLERLQDLLAEPVGTLSMTVEGGLTRRQEPRIACIIQGLLRLQCQRCLQAFDYPLAVRSQLVFVAHESRLPAVEDEQPGIDYVVLEKTLDLIALLEEEVILALPVAPMHPAGACAGVAEGQGDAARPSPFARLAALKKQP